MIVMRSFTKLMKKRTFITTSNSKIMISLRHLAMDLNSNLHCTYPIFLILKCFLVRNNNQAHFSRTSISKIVTHEGIIIKGRIITDTLRMIINQDIQMNHLQIMINSIFKFQNSSIQTNHQIIIIHIDNNNNNRIEEITYLDTSSNHMGIP